MSDVSLFDVTQAMDKLIKRARENGIAPHTARQMRLYSTKEVCQMIGKSTTSLYNAESQGIISKPQINEETGRRIGYTLEDINVLRQHFGIRPNSFPKNHSGKLGITTAIYNFKGGCGKTTTAVCLSQYLAIQGFKVLVVDMDSQASTTSLFGYIPDDDIEADDTVLPFTLYNEKSSLDYAVRPTHIDGLYLIPANQYLSSSEFEAASQVAGKDRNAAIEYFQRLNEGIDTIRDDFDFIFVDAPPSLGIVGIQTLLSVDNIVIPCPPRMLDFVSTRQFLQTATEYVGTIAQGKTYNSVKVMVSMYDKRNSKSQEFVSVMEVVLRNHMYENPMLHSESIDNSTAVFQTPWESDKPDKRITENMRHVFNEIATDLIQRNLING
ncbi:AAA family ATPase [Pseudoalteromonas sp.]|uniref:AAA family ATPase n=1 Tax=Pseudoalteromonas sp. TaxID=53249 RepID=UPI00260679F2|nr:AAA family ATPase [Pseudoalteromonas sp.]MCP4589077.1 AAA family ATPase [Pseudoalteromonas sp.]